MDMFLILGTFLGDGDTKYVEEVGSAEMKVRFMDSKYTDSDKHRCLVSTNISLSKTNTEATISIFP